MFLSKACEYGLRASLYLAAAPPGQNVSIRTVSEVLGMPYPFLAKVVQTLAQQGLVASSRGAGGGIALARPAAQISLRDIVQAIDGGDVFTQCVLGLPGCGERQPCPLHDKWAPTRARITAMFDDVSLADLGARIQNQEFRLSTLFPQPERYA